MLYLSWVTEGISLRLSCRNCGMPFTKSSILSMISCTSTLAARLSASWLVISPTSTPRLILSTRLLLDAAASSAFFKPIKIWKKKKCSIVRLLFAGNKCAPICFPHNLRNWSKPCIYCNKSRRCSTNGKKVMYVLCLSKNLLNVEKWGCRMKNTLKLSLQVPVRESLIESRHVSKIVSVTFLLCLAGISNSLGSSISSAIGGTQLCMMNLKINNVQTISLQYDIYKGANWR